MIHVHEDSDYNFYFSNGIDQQSISYNFKETLHQVKFLKDLGFDLNYEMSGINWDAYLI